MAFSTKTKYTRFLIVVAVFTLVLYAFRDRISDATYFGSQSFDTDPSGHFDWSKLPVRYPVSSLHPLPTGEALKLPKVQHQFPAEAAVDRSTREHRRNTVRDVFIRGWKSYREHAWMADELVSLSDMHTSFNNLHG